MRTIHVRPTAAGWTVSSEDATETTAFFEGAHAEAGAYRIARAMAKREGRVQVLVCGQTGSIIASAIVGPETRPGLVHPRPRPRSL